MDLYYQNTLNFDQFGFLITEMSKMLFKGHSEPVVQMFKTFLAEGTIMINGQSTLIKIF